MTDAKLHINATRKSRPLSFVNMIDIFVSCKSVWYRCNVRLFCTQIFKYLWKVN